MIIHTIHVPVGARHFVAPLVARLRASGIPTELWVEDRAPQRMHLEAMSGIPLRLIESDLISRPIELCRRWLSWYRALRRIRPLAVHAHQTRAAPIPLSAAWAAGVPIRIYHNHGLPYLGHRGVMRQLLRGLERINLTFATAVLLVGRENRDSARRDGLLSPRCGAVLGRGSAVGIDLMRWSLGQFSPASRIKARLDLGLPKSAFVVLFVGRPYLRKGFGDLLAAWAAGDFASRGGHLLLVGFSAKEAVVGGFVIPIGATLTGMVSDVRPFYAACDVVCLPSWHEGFPYALLEASAAGRACVATSAPGMGDAVHNGVNGRLVPLRDIDALSQVLHDCEVDADGSARMGAAGRLMVENGFDQCSVLDRQVAWFRRLVERNRNRVKKIAPR